MVKGKLYLFGGTSDPRASECLPGVYSFDIGEDVVEVVLAHCCSAMTILIAYSVSDLGVLGCQGCGPHNTQTQFRCRGRQHLCVRRPSERESYQ